MRIVTVVPLVAVLAAVACGTNGVQRNTALDSQSHAVNFDISDGGSHALDCSICHSGASFKAFSCTGCHQHDQPTMNAAHAGLTAAFSWTPTSCYQCHAPGTKNIFNHDGFFLIRKGSMHFFECAICHKDLTDRTQVDCLGCHPPVPTDGQHANVAGYVRDSKSCYACHPKGTKP